MFFCPVCNNSFDITKALSQNKQQGGEFDTTESESSKLSVSENKEGEQVSTESNTQSSQTGGINYDQLIQDVLDKKANIDVSDVNLESVSKNPTYKKLKTDQKQYVYNKILEMMPKASKPIVKDKGKKLSDISAYFECDNCGFVKKIEPGTRIFTRASENIAQSYATDDYKELVNSDILPVTRKYICPNSQCESHKDPTKREAVFFRLNKTYKVRYICRSCKTDF